MSRGETEDRRRDLHRRQSHVNALAAGQTGQALAETRCEPTCASFSGLSWRSATQLTRDCKRKGGALRSDTRTPAHETGSKLLVPTAVLFIRQQGQITTSDASSRPQARSQACEHACEPAARRLYLSPCDARGGNGDDDRSLPSSGPGHAIKQCALRPRTLATHKRKRKTGARRHGVESSSRVLEPDNLPEAVNCPIRLARRGRLFSLAGRELKRAARCLR